MNARELNFDGIVGPTHNYSGLSVGNLASERNVRAVSNPKAAAKQGLRKMKLLHDLGVPQGVLPPQDRPAVEVLRIVGFTGDDERVLRYARQHAPELFAACCSASSMWAANAATVCPSADSEDGKVHFTPANLRNHFHRAIEAPTTTRVLKSVFHDEERFCHHPPLPSAEAFGDEGAANHSRFCSDYGAPGLQLFVYGRRAFGQDANAPVRFPVRQTLEASRAVARLHRIETGRVVFAQQSPDAIDHGVFHNDVVAVGNQHVFIFHERAFVHRGASMRELLSKASLDWELVEVAESEIPLDEAVATYLFNSQLVTLPSGRMALIVPRECETTPRVWAYLADLRTKLPVIDRIEVVDVSESMRNGGGPACLRLRVVLTDDERAGIRSATLLDENLFERLNAWVDRHYRDRLAENDLDDPLLLDESRAALDELTKLLDLGSIYPFQGSESLHG